VRARSDLLKSESKSKRGTRSARKRLPRAERREQILNQAAEFFSEYGLTGQTRELAAACGVSQRLLYRFFPAKAALLAEVYARTILGPFEGAWFAELADRSCPLEARLVRFYDQYLETVLTRKWLRLFLYSSLADGDMAPNYITAIVTRLMEVIVDEMAAELDVEVPDDPQLKREIGWTLHGAVSHLAIRRRIYSAPNPVSENHIVRFYVRGFIAGFPDLVACAAAEA
jgi:AcrR family transcriptional regulator